MTDEYKYMLTLMLSKKCLHCQLCLIVCQWAEMCLVHKNYSRSRKITKVKNCFKRQTKWDTCKFWVESSLCLTLLRVCIMCVATNIVKAECVGREEQKQREGKILSMAAIASLQAIHLNFGRRGSIRCGISEPSGEPAPIGQKTRYNDGLAERVFMGLFARKIDGAEVPSSNR